MATTHHDGRAKTTRLVSNFTAGTGVWLVLAPFILGYAVITGALWNDVACGILVAVLAFTQAKNPFGAEGASWTIAGVGAWLILAPFILAYAAQTTAGPATEGGAEATADTAASTASSVAQGATWNDIIVGVLLIALGAWSATQARKAGRTTTRL